MGELTLCAEERLRELIAKEIAPDAATRRRMHNASDKIPLISDKLNR